MRSVGKATTGREAGWKPALRLPAGTPQHTARLYRIALVRWADVPRAAVKHLGRGTARGLNAWLHFNGDLDRVTLLPGKRGKWRLAFKVELLRAAGVDTGDTVTFALAPDTASREPELPEAMREEFQARTVLAARWGKHSLAMRRQVVRYIGQAKSPEVRARRCWIFIERLAETGSLSQQAE